MEAAPGDGDLRINEGLSDNHLSLSMNSTCTQTAVIRWGMEGQWMDGGVSQGLKVRVKGEEMEAWEGLVEEVHIQTTHILYTLYIPYIQITPTISSTPILIPSTPITPTITMLTLFSTPILPAPICHSLPLPPLPLLSTPTLRPSLPSGSPQLKGRPPAVTVAQTASRLPHLAGNPPWGGRVAPTLSTYQIEGPPRTSTTTTASVMTVTALTMRAATVSTKISEVFKKTPSTPITPTTPTGSCRGCMAVPALPLPPPYPAPSLATLRLLHLVWLIKNDTLSVNFSHLHHDKIFILLQYDKKLECRKFS